MPRHLRHAWVLGTFLMAGCTGTRAPSPPPAKEPPPIPALVPAPSKIATCAGPPLKINAETRVSGARDVAGQLERWLGVLPAAPGEKAAIELRLLTPDTSDPALEPPSIEAQSFTVAVDGQHAVVSSPGRAGLFYGAQVLAQLAGARPIGDAPKPAGNEEWSLPCVTIEDRPRVRFRVMHLDVSRHFFDRRAVERYVDLLSFYRFNVFHWHVIDDQGFRLDLARHPELTSPDASYSRSDVTEVVAHARERFVTVVPEVEMPGHARAILAAHPELSCTGEQQTTPSTWGIFEDVLCAGNPGSLALVKDILDEVAQLFPSHFIHVGGDEVPDTRWNACPKCQALMKAAHVDAIGLEHLFMEQVFAHLATLHRRPMVWDEALPEKPGANPPVIVAWQSKERGDLAVQRGFDTIYAPYQSVYFNSRQSAYRGLEPGHESLHLPLETVRAFDPGTGPRVLGGEGALWTEFVWSPQDVEALVMPRAAALAESLWSGPREDFERRFTAPGHLALLDRSKVLYFIAPPEGMTPRRVVVDEAYVTLSPPSLFRTGTIRYTRDGSTPNASSPRYRDPLQVTDRATISAALFLPNGRSSPVVRTEFVKETPRPGRPGELRQHANCTYYEGEFHRLSQIPTTGERAKVKIDAPSPSSISVGAVLKAVGTNRNDHFAFRCEADLAIATTGVQRIVVKGDDGVRVSIDGDVVVEIDGELGPRTAEGEIALGLGLHHLDVVYFQGTEGKELTLEVQGRLGAPSSTLPHK